MAYDFKRPEEVKEFLKNLHIEYKFGCYSEKKPEVCHLLGDFVESIKKDFNAAVRIYKKNCDEYNFGRSCAKFGDYSLIGKGCEKNMKMAWDYMRKGCELNDENGCVHGGIVGVSYLNGIPRQNTKSEPTQISNTNVTSTSESLINDDTKDANTIRKTDNGVNNRKDIVSDETTDQIMARIKMSVSMLEKACATWNSDKACFYLAGVYLAGIDGYVEKNFKEAYKVSLKSCELGNPYSCANVSRMHKLGDGVQKSPDLAETFMRRAEELLKEIENAKPIQFQQSS